MYRLVGTVLVVVELAPLRCWIGGHGEPLYLCQVGKRWVSERTHSWMNGYGKLRRYTDHDTAIVDFREA